MRATKQWGECQCGCGQIILPGDLFTIKDGWFIKTVHKRKETEMAVKKATKKSTKVSPKPKSVKKAVIKKTVKKNRTNPKQKPATKSTPAVQSVEKRQGPKPTPNRMCRDLLILRKYTDEQIVALIKARFPDKPFNTQYISATRSAINTNYFKGINEDFKQNPVFRMIEKDGKIVPCKPLASGMKKTEEKNKAPVRKAPVRKVVEKSVKKSM